ncbi:MAG: HU family DNA-binding protein [Bacteroidales bacterium]|jgi:predicted histone-like DNA-binding protein
MINYAVSKRRIVVGATPGIKFLACLVRSSKVSQEDLITRIAAASSLAEGDVLACLRQLQIEISSAVRAGQSVELDQLGTYTPYLQVTTKDTEEEVDASTIKRIRVNFVPNSIFKSKLKATPIEYKNPTITGLQTEGGV